MGARMYTSTVKGLVLKKGLDIDLIVKPPSSLHRVPKKLVAKGKTHGKEKGQDLAAIFKKLATSSFTT